MARAISFTYQRGLGKRPMLLEQFETCRAYADAHGHQLMGEFNATDVTNEHYRNVAIDAIRSVAESHGATLLLVFEPEQDVLDMLRDLGLQIEAVPRREVSATPRG